MVVGILHVDIRLDGNESIKAKRSVLNSVQDQVRNRFNVSIAEVDMNDVLNFAALGVVVASNEQKHANQVLSQVENFLESHRDCVIEDVSIEFV